MKKIGLLIGSILLVAGFAQAQDPRDSIFQVSTLGALLEGEYDGAFSFEQLAAYGDFGLGTFEGVDGELIVLDGVYYQVTADGLAREVEPEQLTPFAAVTFFDADQTLALEDAMRCTDLYAYLDQILPSPNIFYAIKITGEWKTLQTRSPQAQEKPYPPLGEVIAQQVVFDFEDVEATLVGFWLPPYMSGLNSAGYHFHALTADQSTGGHVLDCEVSQISIEIDETDGFQMLLPNTDSFLNELNLSD